MSPSPVTVAYEYERPRFRYTVTHDGEETTAEANYCLARDGSYEFVEVTDVVATGRSVEPETAVVASVEAEAVKSLDHWQVSTDVWELQVIRPPTLLDRLLPWRWPPDVTDPGFAEPAAGEDLIHPEADELATCSAELLHSLDEIPPEERP